MKAATLFIATCSLIFLLGGCNGSTAPKDTTPYKEDGPPKSIEPEREWKALKTFTGKGSMSSEVLEVNGTQVKILCSMTGSENDGTCFLHCWMIENTKTLESDNQAQVESFETKTCGDSEGVIYRGMGKYFLQVDAKGSWKLEVFEK